MVLTTIVIAVLAAVVAALVRSEFEAWMPWIAERLHRLSLRPLEGDLRERFDEEWRSHLDDVPGFIGKVVCALGFNIASRRIAWPAQAELLPHGAAKWTARSVIKAAHVLNATGSVLEERARLSSARMSARKIVGYSLRAFSVQMIIAGLGLYAWRVRLIRDDEARATAKLEVAATFKRLRQDLMDAKEEAENSLEEGKPLLIKATLLVP